LSENLNKFQAKVPVPGQGSPPRVGSSLKFLRNSFEIACPFLKNFSFAFGDRSTHPDVLAALDAEIGFLRVPQSLLNSLVLRFPQIF